MDYSEIERISKKLEEEYEMNDILNVPRNHLFMPNEHPHFQSYDPTNLPSLVKMPESQIVGFRLEQLKRGIEAEDLGEIEKILKVYYSPNRKFERVHNKNIEEINPELLERLYAGEFMVPNQLHQTDEIEKLLEGAKSLLDFKDYQINHSKRHCSYGRLLGLGRNQTQSETIQITKCNGKYLIEISDSENEQTVAALTQKERIPFGLSFKIDLELIQGWYINANLKELFDFGFVEQTLEHYRRFVSPMINPKVFQATIAIPKDSDYQFRPIKPLSEDPKIRYLSNAWAGERDANLSMVTNYSIIQGMWGFKRGSLFTEGDDNSSSEIIGRYLTLVKPTLDLKIEFLPLICPTKLINYKCDADYFPTPLPAAYHGPEPLNTLVQNISEVINKKIRN